jgi:hypothetical protein
MLVCWFLAIAASVAKSDVLIRVFTIVGQFIGLWLLIVKNPINTSSIGENLG